MTKIEMLKETEVQELERLRRENAQLNERVDKLTPKPKALNAKIPKELADRCHSLITGLREKYKATSSPACTADVAASYAFDVWQKVAAENIRTGEAQLDGSNGESMVEKYYRGRLVGSRK